MERAQLPLTPKQQECFVHLSRGYPTSKGIGRAMNISPKMVDKHFSAACQRLGVSDRREALVIWLASGENTRGDDPPVGSASLSEPSLDGSVSASFPEETADHDTPMAFDHAQTAAKITDDASVHMGAARTPAVADSSGVTASPGSVGVADHRRVAVEVGAADMDAPYDPDGSPHPLPGRPAPPWRFWLGEYELNGWRRLVLVAAYAGVAGIATLIALLAAKAMIALL